MKKIRYMLILVIGGVLFWVALGQIMVYQPPPDWINAIPTIGGQMSKNLTTSAFNITRETWAVRWGAPPHPAICGIEVYNASTDEKLQEFTIPEDAYNRTSLPDYAYSMFVFLKGKGSFYLKIQVYVPFRETGSWQVAVVEFKPAWTFKTWITCITVIGIGLPVVYIGYEIYKSIGE